MQSTGRARWAIVRMVQLLRFQGSRRLVRWLSLMFLIPSVAAAETWDGSAHVVDGDTIYVDQVRLRLISIDAFETDQTCMRGGQQYPCGTESTRALLGLIGQRPVHCEGSQRDRYGRPLVRCTVGGGDLGRAMVRLGWAVAEFGTEYKRDEEEASVARSGAWMGSFQRPREWRASRGKALK